MRTDPLIINGKNYDILLDNIRLKIYRKALMREYIAIAFNEMLGDDIGKVPRDKFSRRFEDQFLCSFNGD